MTIEPICLVLPPSRPCSSTPSGLRRHGFRPCPDANLSGFLFSAASQTRRFGRWRARIFPEARAAKSFLAIRCAPSAALDERYVQKTAATPAPR